MRADQCLYRALPGRAVVVSQDSASPYLSLEEPEGWRRRPRAGTARAMTTVATARPRNRGHHPGPRLRLRIGRVLSHLITDTPTPHRPQRLHPRRQNLEDHRSPLVSVSAIVGNMAIQHLFVHVLPPAGKYAGRRWSGPHPCRSICTAGDGAGAAARHRRGLATARRAVVLVNSGVMRWSGASRRQGRRL